MDLFFFKQELNLTMEKNTSATGKKMWTKPTISIIDRNNTIEKNFFTNKESHYHHVTGTHYDNANGTIHVNKMTFDSCHS